MSRLSLSIVSRLEHKQDFIGNHGGSNVGVWTFYVNDPLDFCTALWNKSIEYIHRGVKFTNNNGISDCQWIETPTITSIDCFLALYDVTQKRNILCTTLDGLRLHRYKTSHRDYE